MASDGKDLETLVRTVEELFLPAGCKVEARKLVRGESGAQLAELDILVTGKLGTTEIRWLIECRNRPSDGRAPTAWIEQLAGRQDLHGFNKVTAVSTTGFAAGAAEMAAKAGIELRTLDDASDEDIRGWFTVEQVVIQNRTADIETVTIIPHDNEPAEKRDALSKILHDLKSAQVKLLRLSSTGTLHTCFEVFASALEEHPEITKSAKPGDAEATPIAFHLSYPDGQDHFLIDTNAGPVRVQKIEFHGKYQILHTEISPHAKKSYKREESGELIAQSVLYAADVQGRGRFSFELHNKSGSGEMVMSVRKLDSKSNES